MHLHGYLSDCINDYGSVYGFWLFSYERYNGILQNNSSNKRDITVQLMQRSIYDCLCYNKALPKEFQEHFNDLVLFNKVSSEIHHDIANGRPLTSSNDLDSQSLKVPSVSKTSVPSAADHQHLRAAYATIFQHDIPET